MESVPPEQEALSEAFGAVPPADTIDRHEESYRLLVEGIQEYAIFMLDRDGYIITWNVGAQRLFGYTEAEALGQLGAVIFTEEDRAAGIPEQEIATAIHTGKAEDNRWHVRQDGSRFWATGVMTALFTADGDLRGFAKIMRDNTDRKLAQAALHEREAHFRQIWELTSDALVLSDAEGMVLDANPAYLLLYGYSRDQIVGQHFSLIFPEEQQAEAMAQYKALFTHTTPPEVFEAVVRHADGTKRIVESRATFFTTQEGQRTALLSTIRNITQHKAAEAALRQARDTLEMRVEERTRELVAINMTLQAQIAERQRVEAQLRQVATQLTLAEQGERRRLAQRLHDDLQQQLYGIQLRLLSIMTTAQASTDALLATYAQEAHTWLDDAIRTTRQLTVDLSPPILRDEGLVDALGWLATQMAETHGLQVMIKAPSAFRMTDTDLWVLLFQIVHELLVNVADHADTDQATVELQEGEAGDFIIRVSDRGRGFTVAEAMTTDDGGFGLFSVRERLALFGGRMEIYSTPGSGTQVTLAIPHG